MTSADKELETGLASPPRGFPVPILALTPSAFTIGAAEFVIAGLLPEILRDLRVSIPAAGQFVTAYAIGAPTVAIATSNGFLFGVGVVVATDLVAPNKRASAVALMFSG